MTNSSQSVIPVFREQIEEGDPVTLTDSKMNRFFLTYDDVAELVLGAMTHTHKLVKYSYKKWTQCG